MMMTMVAMVEKVMVAEVKEEIAQTQTVLLEQNSKGGSA